MTFSRHYAKARKAATKQQMQGRKPSEASPFGQAQRLPGPSATTLAPDMGRRLWLWFLKLVSVSVLVLVVTGLWAFHHELSVPIRHINVTGQLQRVDAKALQTALGTVAEHSMFSNLLPVQRQLLALPWVKTVEIKRVWPNSLQVNISELAPLARFNDNLVLTDEGTVIAPPSAANLAQLPLLVGPPDKALTLWQAYQAMSAQLAPIGLKVWRLALSPRFSYDVVLNNGLILYLGTSQVMDRLQLFTKIYGQQLAAKLDQITYVDLRYASSLAIGWKAPTTPVGEAKPSGAGRSVAGTSASQ